MIANLFERLQNRRVLLNDLDRMRRNVDASGMMEVIPPRVDAVCPIGAGDAMAAAFLWAISNKNDFSDAVRWAVAAGTASAKLPGLAFANLEQTKEVYKRVEIRSV